MPQSIHIYVLHCLIPGGTLEDLVARLRKSQPGKNVNRPSSIPTKKKSGTAALPSSEAGRKRPKDKTEDITSLFMPEQIANKKKKKEKQGGRSGEALLPEYQQLSRGNTSFPQGSGAGPRIDLNSGKSSGKDFGKVHKRDSGKDLGKNFRKDSGKYSRNDFRKDPAKDSRKESGKDTDKGSAKDHRKRTKSGSNHDLPQGFGLKSKKISSSNLLGVADQSLGSSVKRKSPPDPDESAQGKGAHDGTH